MIIADAFFPAIPNCANCISECANCILLQEYQSVFSRLLTKKDRGKPPEVPDPIQAGNHPDFLSLFRLMILFFFCSGLFYISFSSARSCSHKKDKNNRSSDSCRIIHNLTFCFSIYRKG